MPKTSEITVDALIEQATDSRACGILIASNDVMRWFGRKSRVPVVATIGEYSYRTSLSPMGGRHALPVNAEVRDAAGVAAGDRVKLRLREDTQPRTVDVPPELAKALSGARAREAFDAMSFTHRKEWVRAILDAKRPETRTKRIADCVKAVAARKKA